MAGQSGTLPQAGESYRCDVCGMEVQVTEDCRCSEGEPKMECCNKPMAKK